MTDMNRPDKRLALVDPTELDYMLNGPDDRAGALGFGLNPTPPAPVRRISKTIDLQKLIEIADQIIESDNDPIKPKPAGDDAEQAEQLLKAGTSMGGARPKVTVEDADRLWLAKFPNYSGDPAQRDKWNNPRVEHATI